MATDIKAHLAQGFEAYNEPGRRSEWIDLHDPSAVTHGFAPQPLDLDGLKAFYDSFFAAFPDAHFTIGEVVQEGETVAVRGTIRGTHQGEFLGIPATERSVEFMVMGFFHFREGKIVERWDTGDILSLMVQLGAIPAPTAPSTAP